jgi:hypothetical protein
LLNAREMLGLIARENLDKVEVLQSANGFGIVCCGVV